MEVLTTKSDMRAFGAALRKVGRSQALVPTMGALHEGHLSLVRRAGAEADATVVSIFVNPTQFGPEEDFSRYPRDMERDLELCRAEGAAAIFAPSAEEMYVGKPTTFVGEEVLASGLCGAFRPGHFRGVLTVVAKLFHVVQPDVAVFGRKDLQQARLIEQMVRDLDFPVRICTAPTVREDDGLAMSSRNRYLDPAERKSALSLYESLGCAQRVYNEGERDPKVIERMIREQVSPTGGVELEYVEIVSYDTLKPVQRVEKGTVVALAARVGNTRLIDNVVLGGAL
jgi:pantoate--beta-alanine ligase